MALPEVKVRITADDKGLDKGLSRASGKLSSFAKFGIRAATTALAAVPAAFVLATRSAINFADEMAKTAQRVGMTTAALSKLEYAAKLSDVSLADLRVGLSQLARNMDMNSDAFERLGISIRNQDGSLKDTNTVFTEIAERMSNMQNGAEKTALAMELLGRSGANMVPLLNSGAAGLKEMADEAWRMGLVIDEKTSKRAEQFNDNLTRMGMFFTGIARRIAADVLPALVNLSNRLVELTSEMQSTNIIADGFKWVLKEIAILLENIAQFALETNIYMGAIGETIDKIKSGDFAGVLTTWETAAGKVNESFAEMLARIQKINDGPDGEPLDAGTLFGGGKIIADNEPDKDAEKLKEQMERRLQFLRESMMSERELLINEYNEKQNLLTDSLNKQLMSETEYADRRRRLEQGLQDDLARMDEVRRMQAMGATSTLFGGLAQLATVGGKKLFNIAKAFSIAEAVMNTAQAVTKSLTSLPFPFNLIAAAGTAAAGAAQIATIAATSPGGGGGGIKSPSASGGGGAASAAAAAPAAAGGGGGGRQTQVALQLTGGDMFGRDQVISLINAINEAQEDGAVVRLV